MNIDFDKLAQWFVIAGAAMIAIGCVTIVFADTVYFDNGESVEVPSGELYRSSEPLYGVTGDLSSGLGVTPADPLKAPTEPVVEPQDPFEGLCDGPRPTGTVTFELVDQQKYWDKYCKQEEEYVPDCDAPRPAFDGTFESIDKGWIWDSACAGR